MKSCKSNQSYKKERRNENEKQNLMNIPKCFSSLQTTFNDANGKNKSIKHARNFLLLFYERKLFLFLQNNFNATEKTEFQNMKKKTDQTKNGSCLSAVLSCCENRQRVNGTFVKNNEKN